MQKTLFLLLALAACLTAAAQAEQRDSYDSFHPGRLWLDTDGRPVNAHGGGVLLHDGVYYWYGEHKGERDNAAHVGVMCYSSRDLMNWQCRGAAYRVADTDGHPTENGCILERPKVVYCAKTRQFVMYFHLELKGRGYAAAERAVAVSDTPCGPFRLVSHGRACPGQWPQGFGAAQKQNTRYKEKMKWWTPEWREQVALGMYACRDFQSGQMCRDQTVFIDDDGTAYHIYSSEDNLTLQIAELTPDYLSYTGRYIRIDPAGHNEAPTMFKHAGKYYMITSGCTGWAPNEARLHVADSIWGPWQRLPNPCRGKDADKTFMAQSTYVLTLASGQHIFMADIWRPQNPVDGRYVWLPITFAEDGLPVVEWQEEWRL